MVVEKFSKGSVFFEFPTRGSKHKRPFLSSRQSFFFQSEYKSETFVGEVSSTLTDMNERLQTESRFEIEGLAPWSI